MLLTLALLVDRDEQVLMAVRGYPCNRHFIPALEGEAVGCFAIPLLPTSGLFAYADCSPFGLDSETFCREALANTRAAFTPGVDFGSHRAGAHARFAHAIAIDRLREGVRRLAAWLPGLRRR